MWTRAGDGTVPCIGGRGRSLLRGVYADKGAEARAKYIDEISNRWRTHRPLR